MRSRMMCIRDRLEVHALGRTWWRWYRGCACRRRRAQGWDRDRCGARRGLSSSEPPAWPRGRTVGRAMRRALHPHRTTFPVRGTAAPGASIVRRERSRMHSRLRRYCIVARHRAPCLTGQQQFYFGARRECRRWNMHDTSSVSERPPGTAGVPPASGPPSGPQVCISEGPPVCSSGQDARGPRGGAPPIASSCLGRRKIRIADRTEQKDRTGPSASPHLTEEAAWAHRSGRQPGGH